MSRYSPETIEKMRASAKRRVAERPWTVPKFKRYGMSPGNIKEKPSYSAIHHWVKYHLGKPQKCENCGSKEWLEWANLSGDYLRDLTDWAELCVRCHRWIDNTGKKAATKRWGDD